MCLMKLDEISHPSENAYELFHSLATRTRKIYGVHLKVMNFHEVNFYK